MPASLSTPPAPRIVFAEKSDPGCDPKKQINEDSCGHLDLPGARLLVVCDGMGGHAGGREASQLAVATILGEVDRVVRETPSVAPHDALRNAVKLAGRQVYGMGGPDGTAGRPGSTCVSILIHSRGTEVAHAGDSRIYLVRNGQIWQITRDHSLVQQMVDAGTVRAEDALNHPDAHVVTRALGMRADIDVELRHEPFPHQAGDLFLLVSDGVSDVASQQDLLTLISRADSTNLQPLCDSIVQFARDQGGPDNITVQAALLLDTAEIEHTERKTVTDVVPVAPAEGAASAAPVSPPAAAPAPPPAPAIGSHGTVVIAAIDPASALATPSPAGSLRPPSSDPNRPASLKTIVDGASADPEPVAPKSRAPKLLIGAGLFAIGMIVVAISLYNILETSEAPPPLPETPASGASASAGSTSTAAAPSPSISAPAATSSNPGGKPTTPGPATGKGKH